MSEAKQITHVSDYTKDWSSPKWGDFTTYYVKVKDLDGIVEINKKQGNDGPAVGDELEGLFTETDYVDKQGNQHYKFKSVPKFGGGAKSSYQPRDDSAIKAQFAIKAAIEWLKGREADVTDIEPLAKDLFAMVERVKTSGVAPVDKVITPKEDAEMPDDFLMFDDE